MKAGEKTESNVRAPKQVESTENVEAPPAVIDSLRRVWLRSRYRADRYYQAAIRWQSLHYVLGVPAAIVAAVAGVAALQSNRILAAVLAVAAAVLSGTSAFLNPGARVAQYLRASRSFLGLASRVRVFAFTGCSDGDNPKRHMEAVKRLQAFTDEEIELEAEAPLVPRWTAKAVIRRLQSATKMSKEYEDALGWLPTVTTEKAYEAATAHERTPAMREVMPEILPAEILPEVTAADAAQAIVRDRLRSRKAKPDLAPGRQPSGGPPTGRP